MQLRSVVFCHYVTYTSNGYLGLDKGGIQTEDICDLFFTRPVLPNGWSLTHQSSSDAGKVCEKCGVLSDFHMVSV